MEPPSILIADKDTTFLKEISSGLAVAGYNVETTTSSVHVISNILKKKTLVVLLGSEIDNSINLIELVRLLKKCNQHLAVILVSDEASLPIVRKIREEGIFYYAMRPIDIIDQNELQQAAICALDSVKRKVDHASIGHDSKPGILHKEC